MKRSKRVIASTTLDSHGEKLPDEGLRRMAEHLHRKVLPLNVEHDPRIPPVGRILGGEVAKVDDNTMVLIADMELFEGGDEPEYLGDKRTMPIHECQTGQFSVGFDRNFRDAEDQKDIEEIGRILRAEPHEEVKKALDPIAVFFIVQGTNALSSMAKGFFSEIGKEGCLQLKAGLKRIFARTKSGEAAKLLILSWTVNTPSLAYESQLVLTNPSDAEIDTAIDTSSQAMAKVVVQLPVEEARVSKVVFTLVDGKVRLSHAIRSDAVPIKVQRSEPGEE